MDIIHKRDNKIGNLNAIVGDLRQENAVLRQTDENLRENCRWSQSYTEQAERRAKAWETEAREQFAIRKKIQSVLDERKQELDQQDAEVRELHAQLVMLKADRAESSHQDEQLTDDTIQSGMESLYYGIRDWALEVVRDKQWGGNPTHLGCRLEFPSDDADQDLDFRVEITEPTLHEWLSRQVPGYQDKASKSTRQALTALVAAIVCAFFDQANVFGTAVDNPSNMAFELYKSLFGQ